MEEFLEWDEEHKIVIKLHKFSPPLERLSTHFIEQWGFKKIDSHKTLVTRDFQLFPKSAAARTVIWLMSFLFRRAIVRHFNQMAEQV